MDFKKSKNNRQPKTRSFLITGTIFIVLVIVLSIIIKFPPNEKKQPLAVKDNMSLRHISERNDVPLESLLSLLNSEQKQNFPVIFRTIHRPIRELNIDKNEIRKVILSAQAGGTPTNDIIRFILLSIIIVIAGLLLLRKKNIVKIRRIWLIAVFLVFGFVLGAAPNPMEATVRAHKLIKGIPGNPIILVTLSFGIFALMSLIGSRMLCSWGCPLGALQESLYNIPILKNFKRRHKFCFSASIAVRITFYLIFVLLLFSVVNINQGGPGSILYHHFNLFKIFNPLELAQFTLLLVPILIFAGIFIFRPFCHTVCPFGLWAWVLEKPAIYKVRKLSSEACIDCRKCIEACPTEAMKSINENQNVFFKPDCWSCGFCLDACPEKNLEFTKKSS